MHLLISLSVFDHNKLLYLCIIIMFVFLVAVLFWLLPSPLFLLMCRGAILEASDANSSNYTGLHKLAVLCLRFTLRPVCYSSLALLIWSATWVSIGTGFPGVCQQISRVPGGLFPTGYVPGGQPCAGALSAPLFTPLSLTHSSPLSSLPAPNRALS